MAAFIRGVPSLVAHAHPTVPLPAFRAAFAAAHPSPRLFSSSSRSAFRHHVQQSHQQPASVFDALRASFHKSAATGQKRGIATGQGAYGSSSGAYGQQAGGMDWGKVGVNVGLGIAGAAGLHLLLNGETKPLEAHEWAYLRSTMKWTGAGLAITAGTAFAAFRNGVTYRLMAMNPWAVAGISLVGGIGSMMGVMYTAPDTPAHYACWAAFSAMQGLTLSPLFFFAPHILGRAGLYTLGATAGISYVGSTAKSDQYLWIGGPLLAGLGVLICTSLAPLVLPATTSLRTLSMLESVGAYGGVALFSGMILYDTNKIRRHANLASRGAIPADPVRESVSLILDIINLFTSIVRVLLLQQGCSGRPRLTAALLVVDVKQGLCVGPGAVENAGRTIDNINQLYDRARQAEAVTIFVQHDEKDDLVYGSANWQLADGLAHHQSSRDLFLRKQGSDAFHQTALERLLRDRNVTRLVVCGMQTEFCVESTVRRALALGFEVTLAADAHTTVPNSVLSVDQIVAHHNKTLSNLGSYGARTTVVATEGVCFDGTWMHYEAPADPTCGTSTSSARMTAPTPRPRRLSTPPDSYAVIGGEGFLGAALVSALLERHPAARVASFGLTQRRFDTPSGDPYRFFRTDITSYDSVLASLRDSGVTTVFHTASPHAKSTPEMWRSVNIDGTNAVVRACQEAGVSKLVFTSSMTVVYEPGVAYKNVDERLPIIETEEKVATYAGTKAAAEKIVLAANGKDGLKTCSLRLGGIIGPGDRQVLPGFIEVYKSGQSIFQMGDDLNLFDFVTLKNVVHAHLLAADRLDSPPISAKPLVSRLEPVQCTIKRRRLPTSLHQDVVDPSKPPPRSDPPLPAMRNRWNQFASSDDEPVDASNLSVAGQAFFITNGEPVTFWTFARAVYFAYSQKTPRWWDPIVLPKSVGMLYAQLSETIGWFQGKKPEDCAVPMAHMQYVLHDLYFDIERARRVLGYEPIESLEDGIKTGVEWYKADEARQSPRSAAAGREKTK